MNEKFDKTVAGALGWEVATFSGEVDFGAIIAHMNVSTTICTGNWWKRTKHRLEFSKGFALDEIINVEILRSAANKVNPHFIGNSPGYSNVFSSVTSFPLVSLRRDIS